MPRVTSERLGHLLHIRLNRPEQQNQFTMEMLGTIGRLCAEADGDPDVRCILLSGSGSDFCTGGDAPDILPPWSQGISPFGPNDINPMGVGTRKLSKPLIAIVQGQCINGGLEFALAADICIAADTARFAFEEISFGTYPFGGGLFRFIRAAGKANALRYALTGDAFDADEALRMHVVAAVKPLGEVHSYGLEFAMRISNSAPLAILAAMNQIDVWTNRGDRAALELAVPDIVRLLNSKDAAEAMRAKQERRAPVFFGR